MKYALILAALAALIFFGMEAMATETVKYTVVETMGDDVEIREYPPHLIAEVTVTGDREESSSKAFRILAGFIFGDNQSQDKVAMTAPVSQSPKSKKIAMTAPVSQAPKSEKIAMTAPVSQSPSSAVNEWVVNFAMPAEYTMDTLPIPNDDRITVRETEPYKVAVIRFNGRSTPKNIQTHEAKLIEAMRANNLVSTEAPSYAFYNAPWTPGFMRRNEVQFRLID